MKMLKNCIKLSNSIKIYVPSTINVDKEYYSSVYVERTLAFLSSKFGGSTSTNALGAWVTENGSLVKEKVTIVLSYCDPVGLEEHIESIYEFCLQIKKDLSQEAIALEINNELYLI